MIALEFIQVTFVIEICIDDASVVFSRGHKNGGLPPEKKVMSVAWIKTQNFRRAAGRTHCNRHQKHKALMSQTQTPLSQYCGIVPSSLDLSGFRGWKQHEPIRVRKIPCVSVSAR